MPDLFHPLPSELMAMRPPEEMDIWRHGERYCTLPKDSAIKGMWIADMVPYARMIFDLVERPKVRSISIVKSSQSGISVSMQVLVGYYTHQEPRPIMIILADQETAEFMADMRYQHQFESHEALRAIIDRNTWTRTRMGFLNGGYIEMGWASSVAKMGSRSMWCCIADETDKPGYNLTTREGSTLMLPWSRLKTYPGSKYIKLSTPTDEFGNIAKEMQQADIVYDWHVPCPHCGQFQPLNWWLDRTRSFWWGSGEYRSENGEMHPIGCVTWDGGRDATNRQIEDAARYLCADCGGLWTTEEKNGAVWRGKAVSRTAETGDEVRVGVCIPELLSLFDSGRLETMVQNWVNIFKNPDREQRDGNLQDFVNSSLAEPHKQVTLSTSETAVLSARCDLPPQTVPVDAVALVCGIDQQKYGYWFVVRAFAADYTSWMIHSGYLSSEEELEGLLFDTRFPRAGDKGEPMRIWRAGYDTGGGDTDYEVTMTERAYLWLARNWRGRGCMIWPTKGSSYPMPGRLLKMGNKIQKLPSGQALPHALQLIELNTFDLKSKFHRRLSYAIEGKGDAGAAYLHAGTTKEYAAHIMSEERRKEKGVECWVKKTSHARNDMLDCECICHALADPEWPGGGVHLLGRKRDQHRQQKQPDEDVMSVSSRDDSSAAPLRRQVREFRRPGWLRRR